MTCDVRPGIVGLTGELVDHVDENDQVLVVVERAEAMRQGWLHRIATIVRL